MIAFAAFAKDIMEATSECSHFGWHSDQTSQGLTALLIRSQLSADLS